jgi:hypothetical protein
MRIFKMQPDIFLNCNAHTKVYISTVSTGHLVYFSSNPFCCVLLRIFKFYVLFV